MWNEIKLINEHILEKIAQKNDINEVIIFVLFDVYNVINESKTIDYNENNCI